jgi:RND family efflux transporter MFP subunit
MTRFRITRSLNRSHILLTLATVVCAGALSLAFRSTAKEQEEKPAVPAKAALTVSTVVTQTADWPLRLTANGNVAAWQEAIVGSEIGGLRLTDVRVNVGDRVRKGQVLATLQSETTAAERDQTLASMAEAEAVLAEAKANADRARQVEGSGALSVQQVTQYLTAERTAAARLGVLKAQLRTNQVRMAQTQIVAPDNGTISQREATLGAVVQSGQELFRLIRRDRLEWRAELPAADLARIKPGMPASITTAGKETVAGRVRMLAPTVDVQTRNGIVYVDLTEKGTASAGMFASGEIEISRGELLTLPQNAVLLRDGYSYVFRLGADNRVVQTKVGVGQRSGDRIAITAGLEPGAPVVATGVGFLADGDLVRVVAAPTAPTAPAAPATPAAK